mmetsp:Transcript_1960/g.2613  ORF Transcript_1960/g.2613 Transcript_1960/m.2613 type:complete len:122 (-) Transcript_1960:30-395(-)
MHNYGKSLLPQCVVRRCQACLNCSFAISFVFRTDVLERLSRPLGPRWELNRPWWSKACEPPNPTGSVHGHCHVPAKAQKQKNHQLRRKHDQYFVSIASGGTTTHRLVTKHASDTGNVHRLP